MQSPLVYRPSSQMKSEYNHKQTSTEEQDSDSDETDSDDDSRTTTTCMERFKYELRVIFCNDKQQDGEDLSQKYEKRYLMYATSKLSNNLFLILLMSVVVNASYRYDDDSLVNVVDVIHVIVGM